MPKVRIGFSSDFVLDSSEVGIGTTNPTVTLDVYGVAKADFDITGVATLTSYGGFVSQKQNVSTASTIGFNTTGIGTVGITSFISVNERETGFISLVGEFNTLSEDLIVDDGKILDVSTIRNIGVTTIGTQNVYVPTNTAVSLGTLESVNVTSHFSVPNGGINSRQQHPTEGMVRFNDDLNTLEFYNGVEWRQFTVDGSSGRGLFAGGVDGPNEFATIEYINISSTGNSINFGSLSAHTSTFRNRRAAHGCASSTRGVFGSGNSQSPTPTNLNVIDYVTIASEGDAIDFGDLTVALNTRASCSSSTRGLWAGGTAGNNTIDYIQISTIGNALDFGDLFTGRYIHGACSSPTRALFGGGYTPGIPTIGSIEVVTISSRGNAVVFGNLTQRRSGTAAVSNSVRGVFAGGFNSPAPTVLTMDYVTIASNGNAVEFGNLTVARANFSGVSNATRGVFAGGYISPGGAGSQFNTLDYITIASTGNAQDFGDLTQARRNIGNCSDSHGGLGGF